MTTYPFADNTYGGSAQDHGVEAPVVLGADGRLIGGHANTPKPPTSPKPGAQPKFSKDTELFRKHVVSAWNAHRPESDHISDSDIPDELLYAFEAIDADPQGNERNLRLDNVRMVKTSEGIALSVEAFVNPNAVMPDPTNGRVAYRTRGKRGDSTYKVAAASPLGYPVLEVPSASALLAMLSDTRAELGFDGPKGSRIADEQDVSTMVSIGLHGVNEEILIAPTILRDKDGNEALVMIAYDGSRRLEATKRVQLEVTGCSPEEVFLTADHFRRGGTPEFSHYDHDALTHIRRGMQFNDHRGGTWVTEGNNPSEEALQNFHAARLSSDIQARTIARTRRIRASILIGVIPSSLSFEARAAASPLLAVTNAKVRSLHIAESSQKQWSKEAQRYKAGEEAINRIQSVYLKGGMPSVPVSSSDLADLMDRAIDLWGSPNADSNVPDGDRHPIRLAASVMAMFTCTDQDGYAAATEALRQFGIAATGKMVRENRSQVAVSIAELCLFPIGTQQGAVARVNTVIERAFRNSAFWDTQNHPGGTADPWWEHIGDPVDQLVENAKAELAAYKAGTVEDGPTKWFGSSGRALAALGIIAQSASPLLRASGNASQLTLNGLGGSRGNTKTTPDFVVFNLLESDERIDQLGEMVAAALGTTLRVPVNTITGTGDPFTEDDLRGTCVGWLPDPSTPQPGNTAQTIEEQYEEAWESISASIDAVLDKIADLTDVGRQDPDVDRSETLLGIYESRGRILDPEPSRQMTAKAMEIQQFLLTADTYARLNGLS